MIRTLSLLLAVCSCGDFKPTPSSYSFTGGLLYVATDVNYSSSSLRYLDKSYDDHEILTSESSDLALFDAGRTLILANRSAGDRNFRILEISGEQLKIGAQYSLDELPIGDPSSALWLDDQHLLLAGLNSEKLYVYQLDRQKIRVLEDTPEIGRPAHLQKIGKQIAIINQGLNRSFQADQSQKILIATWDGSKLRFQKKNGRTAIRLHGSLPSNVVEAAGGGYYLASWCSDYVGSGCHAAVERLNLEDHTSQELVNLDPLAARLLNRSLLHADLKLYVGASFADFRELRMYELGQTALRSTGQTLHRYPGTSIYQGLFGVFSNGKDLILVGDAVSTSAGLFSVYRDHKLERTIEVSAIPSLSGLYVD